VGKPGLICIIVGVVAMSACSSAKSAATDAPTSAAVRVTTTTVHPRATTTTSTPDFSFDDSVPPPKLVNTGKNYVAILKSLEAYGSWTIAHRPDPALLNGFVASGTKLREAYVKLFTSLSNESQRFVEVLDGPDDIRLVSTTSDAFSATIVQRIVWRRVVDTSGHAVREAHFSGLTTYLVLAVRNSGRWVLASTKVTSAPTRLS
jgi:hypothetical protein